MRSGLHVTILRVEKRKGGDSVSERDLVFVE